MAITIIRELPPIVGPAGMVDGDHRKECCRLAENLEYYEVRPDMTCLRCRRCGCRHFTLDAERGVYSFKGR
jgi:hypothetical protein